MDIFLDPSHLGGLDSVTPHWNSLPRGPLRLLSKESGGSQRPLAELLHLEAGPSWQGLGKWATVVITITIIILIIPSGPQSACEIPSNDPLDL